MFVLFIDSTHKSLPEKLSQAGFICDYQPEIKADEIINIIPKYEGVIIRSKIKLDKSILDAAINLKFIGKLRLRHF